MLTAKILVLTSVVITALPAATGGTVEFNRDVRPILSDKCFSCHGPDAASKKIPFRLDSEAAAKVDLGGHRAIVDGDPVASTVVQRITAKKASQKMPPVYSDLKLTDAEIETIRTWIAQGAKWEKHWSFIAPERKTPPGTEKNPIDNFVLENLKRNNLTLSPEATREALIRRVTLDLTGLPPTPAELDAFLADQSPNAYENVVDRLLTSPRYGERMAVRWLDAARYADTNGYQFDGERFMWRWRDWVISAFNRNQPFDQFAVEQLAGDLLPNATREQRIATGFNRNHRGNTEDGIVPEEYAVEYVVDRVETTSAVFLGMTLGCARCHNHKYDPLSQREFYQMFAYFNNVPESGRAMKYGNSPPLIPAPTPDQENKLAGLLQQVRSEQNNLESRNEEINSGQQQWESALKKQPKSWWHPASGLDSAFTMDAREALKVKDGVIPRVPGALGRAAVFNGKAYAESETDGQFDIDDHFTLSAWICADNVADGSILSRMNDIPKGRGYGVHLNEGKLHVNLTSAFETDAIRVETTDKFEPKRWYHIAVTYDGSVTAAGVKLYVDGQPAKSKVLTETLYRPFRNAGKKFPVPFRIGTGFGKEHRFRGRIDDVRLYKRTIQPAEIAVMSLRPSLREIAVKPEANRTAPEKEALRWAYLEGGADPAVRQVWTKLTELARQREALEASFPTVMVMEEKPQRVEAHLLIRGAYDKPGEVVPRGVPAVLNKPAPETNRDRLGLAKWIVDPANPLTARVTVNRFWQMYFGAGLVKTTEDFGVQGDWPSNPDLLDWLATEFIRTGWDMKAMQKLIVTSATYKQSSKGTPELLARDPENRLLARGPRHRLAPEMVRDQALAAAGLLVEKIGGPSVKPYQPEGLWKDLAMQDMDYVQSKGSDLYRRSLYTFWKRTIPPPMMVNFDAAGREACVVRESRTNTPLQALNLMNDVTFLEAARFIGQRMMTEGGNDVDSRLRYGFRLLTARLPKAAEMEVLRNNFHYHSDYYASDPARAAGFLKQGDSPADPKLNAPELAAWASIASLMLNLDEVITEQ